MFSNHQNYDSNINLNEPQYIEYNFKKSQKYKNTNVSNEIKSNNIQKNGQKKKFEIQKKQFIENKYSYPLWYQNIVDYVYNLPSDILHIIKSTLYSLSKFNNNSFNIIHYNSIIIFIIEEINKIGILAKYEKYYDNLKKKNNNLKNNNLKNDNFNQYNKKITMFCLDNKIKWLSGTCHLLIRKIYEMNPNELEQETLVEHVNKIMQMIKNIPKLLYEIIKSKNNLINIYNNLIENISNDSWLLSKIKELNNYPYIEKDIKYVQHTLEKLLPIINYINDEYDIIKSSILDPNIKTFSNLANIFKKYKIIIRNYIKHYMIIS